MICHECQMAYNRQRKPMVMPCGHSSCNLCFRTLSNYYCFVCSAPGNPVLNIALYEQAIKKNKSNVDKFFKICLVGNMGVGKTSLLKRLVGEGFEEEMISTIGIDFKYIDKQVQGNSYRYQLWDSAGQERYRCVSKNYLIGSDIILVVYDLGKNSEENGLNYWIDQISEQVNHNNVVVIGNKIDLLENSDTFMMKGCISEDEMKQISKKNWGFMKVSCLTEQNIEQVWEIIMKLSKERDSVKSDEKISTKKQQAISLNSKKQMRCPKIRCCE